MNPEHSCCSQANIFFEFLLIFGVGVFTIAIVQNQFVSQINAKNAVLTWICNVNFNWRYLIEKIPVLALLYFLGGTTWGFWRYLIEEISVLSSTCILLVLRDYTYILFSVNLRHNTSIYVDLLQIFIPIDDSSLNFLQHSVYSAYNSLSHGDQVVI